MKSQRGPLITKLPPFIVQYADPVSDLLDKWGAFRCRLFRESCVFHRGNYVKDLSRLGRDLNKVIIVDNSPASYIFHPDNAVSISWQISTYIVVSVIADWFTFWSRCPWPRGSTTCQTPSCWISFRSLRDWAKWTTSTRSCSTRGPRANGVRLCISALNKTAYRMEMHTPRLRQLSLPTRTDWTQLTDPSPLQHRLWWLRHCHLLVEQKPAWNLPCTVTPPQSHLMNGWTNKRMNECFRRFQQLHWSCRGIHKAEVHSHESSGHRLGTGEKRQQCAPAERCRTEKERKRFMCM